MELVIVVMLAIGALGWGARVRAWSMMIAPVRVAQGTSLHRIATRR
ncbi:MAG: hypothetical protein L0H94_05335 [Nitrospira sp.]|nr:hypothetical protein [Nitrospira sp.]